MTKHVPNETPPAQKRLLTTAEAAEYLSLSPNHLANLRVRGRRPARDGGPAQGGGPAYVKLHGSVRYEIAALEEWIAECRRASTSVPAPKEAV